jgi:uncharacterized protein YecA (UPF0149 family)
MKGRNALCFCGSGKKYKRCHLPVKEATWRKITEKLRQSEALAETVEKIYGRILHDNK